MPKYHNKKLINDTDQYDEILDEKEIEQIIQYSLKFFNKSIKTVPIKTMKHTWVQGDKLYKLAAKYYGNFRLWWVIAIVNKISSEADLKYGQIIRIPLDPTPIVDRI